MPYSALLGRGAGTGRVGMRMEANHADVHHARAFHGSRDPQCQGFSQSRGGFPGALRETWCQAKGRLSHDGVAPHHRPIGKHSRASCPYPSHRMNEGRRDGLRRSTAVAESAATQAGPAAGSRLPVRRSPVEGIAHHELALPSARPVSPDRIPVPPPARRCLGAGKEPRARSAPRPPSPLLPSLLRVRPSVWLRPMRIWLASGVRANGHPRLAPAPRQGGNGHAIAPRRRRRRWIAHEGAH